MLIRNLWKSKHINSATNSIPKGGKGRGVSKPNNNWKTSEIKTILKSMEVNHKDISIYIKQSEMLVRILSKSKHINSAANSIPGGKVERVGSQTLIGKQAKEND